MITVLRFVGKIFMAVLPVLIYAVGLFFEYLMERNMVHADSFKTVFTS